MRPASASCIIGATLFLLGACSNPSSREAAAADDAQCRSYGFAAETPVYSHCRATLGQRRTTLAGRPAGSGNPAGLPIYALPPLLPAPTERGCMTVPVGSQQFTNCP